MLASLDHPANYFSIFGQRGTPQGVKNLSLQVNVPIRRDMIERGSTHELRCGAGDPD